jgi:hypothetical protein
MLKSYGAMIEPCDLSNKLSDVEPVSERDIDMAEAIEPRSMKVAEPCRRMKRNRELYRKTAYQDILRGMFIFLSVTL